MVPSLPRLEASFFRTSAGNEPVREWLLSTIARVLFAVDGKEMVLLHGFIKKSQRTAGDDLELAEARWREWCRG
jgi:phage-related protein